MSYINTVSDLMRELRALRFTYEGKVHFCNYTTYGSYPIVFVFSDGERARPSSVVSHLYECARNLRDKCGEAYIVGVEVFWEGCADIDILSGDLVESAYGDPYADTEEGT